MDRKGGACVGVRGAQIREVCAMKNVLSGLLLCALVFCSTAAMASSLATLDMAGLTQLLRQQRGKVVLVNFFATWCPPCRMEIPELLDVRHNYGEDQLFVLGLSVDEQRAAVPRFLQKMGVSYPVYMAGSDVIKAFRVSSIPHNALYDRQGKRVFSEDGLLDAETLAHLLRELQHP